jgi:telomere length regulation protein
MIMSCTEENAINLSHGLVALVDNFELEGFNEKRQAAVVALVACSPKKTAPALIELLFINQYSMEQRFLIMNALALGARELAGLPVPQSKVAQERIAFPSKRLPPAQDQKYITAEDHWNANAPVQQLIAGISRDLLANTAESSGQEPPQIARERQLRLRQPAKVSVIPPHPATNSLFEKPTQKPRTTFMSVATEYFIHPLIARFWLFFRDEQTREERTANLPELHQYRSAGTGLLLSANILSHFLGTLGVLMHAGRNAPAWGAVLAPDALEVAATMGNRRISLLDDQDDDTKVDPIGPQTEGKNTHAMVLGAALELALVVLDGVIDLDGGRVLGLEHTQLLIGVGEWAAKVFETVEKGERLKGGGGAQEMRLVTTAAGVCLKVEQISKKWGRVMVRM